VWKLGASAQTPLVLGRGKPVVAARFLGSGGDLVTASSDGQIRAWDLKTGRLKASKRPPVGRISDETWAVGLSTDGARVVVGVGTTAQVWDFETERPIGSALKHEKEIVAASFSPDGRLVVTASWDKTARLWDAGTGRMITDPLRHGAELHLALFSPDGRRTVTADAVGAVWIWDVERGKLVVGPIRHPQPSGFTASVGVAFDQEGRRVATVEREGSIQLWDAHTGEPIGPELAEALAGRQFDQSGALVGVTRSLTELRDDLLSLRGTDFWSRLGRWFLMDGPERTLSPMSDLKTGSLSGGAEKAE
jgi:WD40 repeat protein